MKITLWRQRLASASNTDSGWLGIFQRSVQFTVGCLPLAQIELGQFLLAGVWWAISVSVKSCLGNIWVHLYTTNLWTVDCWQHLYHGENQRENRRTSHHGKLFIFNKRPRDLWTEYSDLYYAEETGILIWFCFPCYSQASQLITMNSCN